MPRMSDTQPWTEYFESLGAPLHDIVGHFDSLGQNCEFSFVQEANRFNDGGLLSWAQADDFSAVIRLLEGRFTGLYARDQLEPAEGGVMLRDRRYGLAFHSKMLKQPQGGTYIATPEAERDAIYADDLSKIQYLADKMQRQLREARRIWVYKSQHAINLAQMLDLHGALNTYGPNRLLVVQADPTSTPGVEMLDQGLYHGHLRAYSPKHEAWRFDPEGWATVLRATLRMAGPAR
jgi:hypothetical protein